MTHDDFIRAGYSEDQIAAIQKALQYDATVDVKKPEIKLVSDNVTERVENKQIGDHVTTIYDLQRYTLGQIVHLPDFAEGQPFVARMRRPSLLVMVKSGKIPNKLLATATDLFNGTSNKDNADNTDMLSDTYSVCEAIAEAALVEPTLAEIKDAGMELSDNQLIAIFNYTQRGVEALNNFRKK